GVVLVAGVARGAPACESKGGSAPGTGGGSGLGPGSASGASRKGEPLRVAAAADLAKAFAEVGTALEQTAGKKVEFSFGSTGL
ncbi:hypothetical protein G6O45_31135, partial [Salmonella enterica subsp. enterica serovar Istanbul]|nr:hypothetical protein [Salmonella enterica subsp. enterica serovar Istanbul]